MTVRQQLLRVVYPVLMKLGKKQQAIRLDVNPPVSLFSLSVQLNNGTVLPLSQYASKKLLLVNTASNCGYTRQYDELEALSKKYADQLVVIGFPANDFGSQEPGTDPAIAEFCRVNFGVHFPLAAKSTVIRSPEQHPVFEWLSDSTKNGWNNQAPVWNFCKYLIDEQGRLIGFFGSGIAPSDSEIQNAITRSASKN